MKSLLIIALLIISFNYSFSQTLPSDTSDRVITLDETIVSANKVTEQKKDVSQ
ncbi:MAG: hypothetical protein LH473_01390 [Chitinophagales bacterium]|nr:hypothetical protein [Chitinophagales bacterium]